jgi:hypothetical protein
VRFAPRSSEGCLRPICPCVVSEYRHDVTDNRNDADEGATGSPSDESPLNPDEPVGQFTITVNRRDWQRFEYFSLRTRVQNELRETQEIWPSDGSALEADNNYLGQFSVSFQELVINRLFSTFDHLQLAVWTLETMVGPLIFSQFSLLRSALAGAATAHWIVASNENTRRMRALRLAYYDLNQEAAFARLHVASPAMEQPDRSEHLRKATELIDSAPARLDKIYNAYCGFRAEEGKTKMPSRNGFANINETEIIAEISRKMHELGQYSSGTEVELQYRLMSGFVHNCVWATRTGAKMQTEIGEDRAQRQLVGNAENIYNGAVAAFEIGKLAKARTQELAGM